MIDTPGPSVENQKNGHKGATVQHGAINKHHCPVKALACRVYNVFWGSNSDKALLGHVFHRDSTLSRVADRDINTIV